MRLSPRTVLKGTAATALAAVPLSASAQGEPICGSASSRR